MFCTKTCKSTHRYDPSRDTGPTWAVEAFDDHLDVRMKTGRREVPLPNGHCSAAPHAGRVLRALSHGVTFRHTASHGPSHGVTRSATPAPAAAAASPPRAVGKLIAAPRRVDADATDLTPGGGLGDYVRHKTPAGDGLPVQPIDQLQFDSRGVWNTL